MDGGKRGRSKAMRRRMGMLAGVLWLAMAAAAAAAAEEEEEGGFITVPVVQGWWRRRGIRRDDDREDEQLGRIGMAKRGLLEEETGVNGSAPALAGNVVTLSEDFGQYFAVFQLGTPPVMSALIIDTGSQLLWVQCQPCIECGPQAEGYPVFNPMASSTYKNITCNSNEEICPDNDSVASSCESSRCIYRVTYGDHSNSTGYLSKETLTTSTTTGSSFSKDNVIFGCGVQNNGLEAELNASGLLGLDRGEFSLITQLNVSVFSYCLPNRVHTTEVSGKLTLGKRPSSGLILQYTPMIQVTNPSFRSQFYYINLTGISVNGNLLDIPSAAFEISSSNDSGGTIIDSGTTLSSFVDEAYTLLYDAFKNAMDPSITQYPVRNTDLLCYQVPSQQTEAPTPPNVTLHFDGSLNIELKSDNVFRLAATDDTYNYYCMAFNNAGSVYSGNRNFIGNFQQQDFLVEYDLRNSRIGFAPTVCSTSVNGANILLDLKYLYLGPLLSVLFVFII